MGPATIWSRKLGLTLSRLRDGIRKVWGLCVCGGHEFLVRHDMIPMQPPMSMLHKALLSKVLTVAQRVRPKASANHPLTPRDQSIHRMSR